MEKVFKQLGWQRANFRGDVVPDRLGLCPLLVGLVVYALFAREQFYWLLALGYGVLGFLDDQWGQRAPKGLRGHLRSLLAGHPTTGLLKMVGGLAIGVAIGVRLHEAVDGAARIGAGVVSGLMIALWANFFNLLDVRPGRAGTLFMLMALPCAGLLTMQGDRVDGWVLWGVIVGLLMVLPLDRAGRGMLGDTGSNLLGGVLGTSLALLMPLWLRGLVVVGLLLIHLWAESHSLTEWLERHPLLRRLDRLTGVR